MDINDLLKNIDFNDMDIDDPDDRLIIVGAVALLVLAAAFILGKECVEEEFCDTVRERDDGRCIICGEAGSEQSPLKCTHIVPHDDNSAWADLLAKRLVPKPITCHGYEPRNGILLCHLHNQYFLSYQIFIRWVPQANRFVMINHVQSPRLEPFHGRAVNLSPTSRRVPFHGAFLSHEMSVRDSWPSYKDREITLPIEWEKWITLRPADASGEQSSGVSEIDIVNVDIPQGRDTQSPSKLTVTNPFDNPDELEALRRSFTEQINWTTAVVESESWDGTAEENISKWKKLVDSPPQLHVRKKRRIM